MAITNDSAGRRWVQVEVKVPGTPEQVWPAIASGPGISSWFVPTTIETGNGGAPARVVSNFGPGMESVATITSWNPPQKMTADSADLGPDAPTVATAWSVTGRDADSCVVRVEHSIVTDSDQWDRHLEAWEQGWPDFFRLLHLYLTHFRGQPCAAFQVMGSAPEPKAAAWAALTNALGLTALTVGEPCQTGNDAPPLAGTVKRAGEQSHEEELLVLLDQPGPGFSHLFALPMGGQVLLSLRIHLFGEAAAATVTSEEPHWQAWFNERFPMADPSPAG
jgi:uncharacterized protein YndB with AHSA1/START domain